MGFPSPAFESASRTPRLRGVSTSISHNEPMSTFHPYWSSI